MGLSLTHIPQIEKRAAGNIRACAPFGGGSGITTAFIGPPFAWTGSPSTMTKYYVVYPFISFRAGSESMRRAGTQRIALRTGDSANTNVKWIMGDHLGSTSVTADYAGTLLSRTLYKPLHSIQGRLWGEVRYQSGARPTQYTYTGQYSHTADFGLRYYNARWYDPYLNRFIQPDTIIQFPFAPQSYDRYSYVLNNPLRYIDPTGHLTDEQLVKLFGYKDTDAMYNDVFIKNLIENNPDLWQALKEAQLGDIFAAEVNGVAFNFMFVGTEDDGVGLWDLGAKQLITNSMLNDQGFSMSSIFNQMSKWALYTDDDHDRKFVVSSSSADPWQDYTLSEDWNKGTDGEVKINLQVNVGAATNIAVDVGLGTFGIAFGAGEALAACATDILCAASVPGIIAGALGVQATINGIIDFLSGTALGTPYYQP